MDKTAKVAEGVQIRALTGEDRLAHRRLMTQAFGGGAVVEPPPADAEPPPMDPAGRWGLFDGEMLCAALTILPARVHWGDAQILPMGGIAGVATRPEARGRGYVDALLRQALQAMHDEGQVLSALYPFAWSFYRRYGWDWVGEKRKVKLPLRELRSAEAGRDIVCLPVDMSIETAKEILAPAYTRYAQRYRGVFTSETHRWGNSLRADDNRTTYVYRYEPTGEYLLWRYDRDGKEGTVREWTAGTPEGHHALLSLLHYLATQRDVARVTVPADTPLWSFLTHWNMEVKIEPVFMGRVVDVAGALNALPFAPQTGRGHITLQLTDLHAPWNDGIWRIEWVNGKTEAALVLGRATPDISCDIAAFSQAFWGTPSLAALRSAGRIRVRNTITSESAFTRLCALLPAAPVYTLDDF